MYSNSKDQKSLEQAYFGVLSEERMRFTSTGIPITWTTDTRNDEWDGEVEVDGQTYHANTYYSVEVVDERGDGRTTAPSFQVKDPVLDGEEFHAQDVDGDFDVPVTKENNPELYDKIASAVQSKIIEREFNR